MTVQVEPCAGGARLAVYFVDAKFEGLYLMQRHHHVSRLIPPEYWQQHLSSSEWFELAPGENPGDLVQPDAALVESIAPDAMQHLTQIGFFEALDDAFAPADRGRSGVTCHGDFRIARQVLSSRGVPETDYFDVFHVLMLRGAFCDCEILYNVSASSRLRAEYWRDRPARQPPYNPHRGS